MDDEGNEDRAERVVEFSPEVVELDPELELPIVVNEGALLGADDDAVPVDDDSQDEDNKELSLRVLELEPELELLAPVEEGIEDAVLADDDNQDDGNEELSAAILELAPKLVVLPLVDDGNRDEDSGEDAVAVEDGNQDEASEELSPEVLEMELELESELELIALVDDDQDDDTDELSLEVLELELELDTELELELLALVLVTGGTIVGPAEVLVVDDDVEEKVLTATRIGGTAGGGHPGERGRPQFGPRPPLSIDRGSRRVKGSPLTSVPETVA